jgi:hypothetical protein
LFGSVTGACGFHELVASVVNRGRGSDGARDGLDDWLFADGVRADEDGGGRVLEEDASVLKDEVDGLFGGRGKILRLEEGGVDPEAIDGGEGAHGLARRRSREIPEIASVEAASAVREVEDEHAGPGAMVGVDRGDGVSARKSHRVVERESRDAGERDTQEDMDQLRGDSGHVQGKLLRPGRGETTGVIRMSMRQEVCGNVGGADALAKLVNYERQSREPAS